MYVYKQIDSIVFGLFSSKFVKKMASVKIVTPELYDKEGYPVDGGLMDVRLGVIDPGLRCKTCGGKIKECNGHFGYIDLARPVIHVLYVSKILNFLRSTCNECGELLCEDKKKINHSNILKLLDKENRVELKRKQTRKFIATLKTVKKCPHCKAKQNEIKLEKPTTFYEADKRLSPIDINVRLERISDENAILLGLNPDFARPEWMVLTILPIPPVTMRPSITLESGERSEDDLTHKLGDVVRINQRLFENINAGAPEIIIEDLWDLLQYHVTTFFDNTVPNVPPARHRSGSTLKTLVERIKSKEGRFRYNLAGKRVNFSARTVISPDPKIGFDEVGVPKQIAMKLTVPERVTDWNVEWLKKFIENGPDRYPGANYIVRVDGKKKKITDETREQLLDELENGSIVERHLIDGDISIFNRQPSLHRMSIMCHRIRILSGKSFRLNPAVCVGPDTRVLLSSGIQRKIDELKNCWKESELSTFDWNKKSIKSTELKKFWGLKPEAYGAECYGISTEDTNRKVIATGDHPFYTNKGIKRAKDIKVGDKVIVRPLGTPEYEEIDRIVITKRNINAPKTYIKHSLRLLEDLKLLPLNLKDQRTMILARLLGHLFGDGTFILKDHVGRLIFRGVKEDLEVLQDDIKSLGFKPEKIYIKTYTGEINTIKGKKLKIVGKGASFEVRSKPLALLFSALGAPNGDKVKNDLTIPKWILNAPKYIKREFIGAYFGSELSSPALRNNSKTNFRTLRFKLSKIEKEVNSGLKFIDQIKILLNEFGIIINSVIKEEGNIRKGGEKTISLVANINSNKSYLNLFGRIGYIYSKKKDDKARLAYQYLMLKEKEIEKRRKAYKKFFELRKRGYTFKEISNKLGISVNVFENWMYRKYNAGLMSNFVCFDEWSDKVTEKIKGSGLVWETISEIKTIYCPFVYDVTTTSDTHNFFANGFLTKNCHPYNADFDGDEMNLHIPQNEEARAEAEILMQVQTQIITPKNGVNVIGCVEDSVSGTYLLTKDMILDKEKAIQLLFSIGIESIPEFKTKVNGKEVFSVLLPKDLNFVGRNKSNEQVVIKNGKLVSGVVDENIIGEENGALIKELHRAYDKRYTLDLMSKIFKLGIEVLLLRGFTTGISDTDLPEDFVNKIKQLKDEARVKVKELISRYSGGKLEAYPGKTVKETLEVMILEVLNDVRNKVGNIIAENIKDNSTIIMLKSGARGNILNLAQMAACVGQQSLRGQRIGDGYTDRTLSIFKKHTLGVNARGFIEHGFKEGLNPAEFFFGAMTGRDSLMDTALRTPKSGYLYRRLANALQDLKVEYDYTVRDANKKIIQFKYGEDGIDVSKSENGTINIKKIIERVKHG